jgi:ribonuclease P protein component
MESLKKNEDFKRCYSTGKSYANRYLVLYVCGNGLGRNRIGISVSKKVGNSVVRHRLKRLIKESYRLHENMFNSGLDIVAIARVGACNADFHKIESALLHLMRLHNIVYK